MSILSSLPVERDPSRPAETVRIAKIAARLTNARSATVLVRGTGGDHVGHHASDETGENTIARRELCAAAMADGVLRVVAGDRSDDGYAHLCVPLPGHGSDNGRIVGAICVFDGPQRAWSDDDVAGLTDLAELAAAGLSLRGLAAEREQALEAVAHDNAFLNAVLENLQDGVAACDRDGTLVYFNPALREIHGISEQASTAEDWADAYDLYDATGERPLEASEIPLARAYAGHSVRDQHMVVRTPTRGVQHFLATGSPIRAEDGRTLGAVVSMRDITADHRRRRVRAAHLEVATALSANPSGDEAIATALLHVRAVLDPSAAGVVMLGMATDHDMDDRVVRAVIRTGRPIQAVLDAPHSGFVMCAPIVVAGSVVGALYVGGESRTLLDDLSTSIVEGVATLLGRCLERERSDRLDRELRTTRRDLARVTRHARDYVWSIELLPSGRASLRPTTSPADILGGGDEPGEDGWLDVIREQVDERDLAGLALWRDGLLRGRPGEVTCRVTGRDGVARMIRTRCVMRTEDGRRFIDGVSSDVSSQVRFEVTGLNVHSS